MNKKCFFGIAALFFFSAAFAKKSDVQLFSGLFFTDFEYSVSDNRFFDSGFRGGEFSVSNFNFFGEENHFGFFERLSFQAGDFFGAEFAAGPAFCAAPNDFLRIQASPFFRLGFEFEKNQNIEKYGKTSFGTGSADEYRILLGAGTTVFFFLMQSRRVSPLLGIDFSVSFFCRDFVDIDGALYYLDYENFLLLKFSPFIGVSFNL